METMEDSGGLRVDASRGNIAPGCLPVARKNCLKIVEPGIDVDTVKQEESRRTTTTTTTTTNTITTTTTIEMDPYKELELYLARVNCLDTTKVDNLQMKDDEDEDKVKDRKKESQRSMVRVRGEDEEEEDGLGPMSKSFDDNPNDRLLHRIPPPTHNLVTRISLHADDPSKTLKRCESMNPPPVGWLVGWLVCWCVGDYKVLLDSGNVMSQLYALSNISFHTVTLRFPWRRANLRYLHCRSSGVRSLFFLAFGTLVFRNRRWDSFTSPPPSHHHFLHHNISTVFSYLRRVPTCKTSPPLI
ncbi:hypothetical protein M0804_010050 [Polistes exclamans]|nr:hypothetical protein M0804_010050 [Polistes exclamans]